ncbi:MAG: hypothetical protein KJ057_11010 [Phycisphaerae bacterium]|nr:MAG: hypothetical protein EDS66_02495 [Planctomycetota bacterium]KAB2938778.1 MAG: hypothetical protein F9K17_15490 [Phycisphaerae bacterium]MBE7457135.1 hypothetical protein [Planctomycetia bacterium]MCK6463506.1 hypothetical protein [Phycisphaerae bacterium]MCL4718988.1 hypothetical protein [Phycisphaerae bacterium]
MPSERRQEAAATAPAAPKKSNLPIFILVGGLMVIEGVGVFFVANLLGGDPVDAAAETVEAVKSEEELKWENPPDSKEAECVVTECKPVNVLSGKVVYYSVRVSILVPREKLAGVQKMVEQHKGRIEDAVNTVIRSAESRVINEPTLQTLKRQLKGEIARILQDEEVILDVLLPELIQMGAGK